MMSVNDKMSILMGITNILLVVGIILYMMTIPTIMYGHCTGKCDYQCDDDLTINLTKCYDTQPDYRLSCFRSVLYGR